MVNETIQFYNVNKSSVYVAGLCAQKAFDKLWRTGLFFKLKNKIDDILWRALYNYYNASCVTVKLDNEKNRIFAKTGGVKQGGVLSPHLFNFYIDELLQSCTELNIGCKIGSLNCTIFVYCGDIILLSSIKRNLQK